MNDTPNLTSCRDIVARLWPYLDGALPESERGGIIAHLEACTACRSHFDFAQAFLDAVGAARAAGSTPMPALRSRVLAALAGEGFSHP